MKYGCEEELRFFRMKNVKNGMSLAQMRSILTVHIVVTMLYSTNSGGNPTKDIYRALFSCTESYVAVASDRSCFFIMPHLSIW